MLYQTDKALPDGYILSFFKKNQHLPKTFQYFPLKWLSNQVRIKVNLKGNFTQELHLAIPDVLAKKKHKHTIQFRQGAASLNWFKSP